MTAMLARRTAKTDRELHEAVIQELKWDAHVDETDVGVEVDNGVVTLTGTVGSYAKKLAALEAVRRVAGVMDVANDIRVKVPGGRVHSDTEIAQAVRKSLEWDALIAHDHVRSTVSDGWVTLDGEVPFVADRTYSEWAVRNLIGVQGVINNLAVSSPMATEAVRHSIEAALARRADREAERIHVEVKDGSVILTGRVHNWNEKQAVLGAAGYAPGVLQVEDHLRVDPYF